MRISARTLAAGITAAALALASCATPCREIIRATGETPADRLARSSHPQILFIGNSLSAGVPPELAAAAAKSGKRIRLAKVTHDGWSLRQHVRSAATLREISARPWDIVVFQERSDRPAKWWERKFFMIPALGFLAEKASSRGALPVIYQTWGHRSKFQRMNGKIAAGCDEAAEKLGGIFVVRAGDAWAREVSAGNADAIFMPDGKHPSHAGNKLTAEAFAEVFFPRPSVTRGRR